MVGIVVGISSWDQLTARFVVDADVLVFLLLLLPAWGVTMLIARVVNRERPYLELKEKPLIDPFVHTTSFPSAHATFAFSILAFSLGFPHLWPWMLAFAILVCLGRIATGVHFISDIIAGALIGFVGTKATETLLLLIFLYTK